jgi:uncharacterized protein (TIRG00374 family)
VWRHVQSVRIVPLLAAVIIATLSFPVRVPRWRILLRHDDGREIRWSALWHPVAIGFACNNVLPFRLGEVVRVGAVSRLAPVSVAASLSSVAVERIVDGLTVVGLLMVAVVVADLPPDIAVGGVVVRDAALRFGLLGLVALAGGLLVAMRRDLAIGMARRFTPPGRLRELAVSITERIVDGLAALGDPRRALLVVAWSLALWLVNATAFWVGFAAFGIEVPFVGAILLQGILVFAIAVPQAPGYVGGFELAIIGALALFGIDEGLALAFAVTFHVTTFVPITLLGAWSLIRTGLSIRGAREAAT